MKQYEKMGFDTEAALKWVKECHNRVCFECPVRSDIGSTALCASSYLLSDVPELPKIPRWTTAKTQADFEKLFENFISLCCRQDACQYCEYDAYSDGVHCYNAYLSELVEAPEGRVE